MRIKKKKKNQGKIKIISSGVGKDIVCHQQTFIKEILHDALQAKINLFQMVNLRYKELGRGRDTKQLNGNKFNILVTIINVNEPNVLVKR